MEQHTMQLDFFREETPITILTDRVGNIEQRVENARKGLFSRFNDLSKKYIEVVMMCNAMRLEIAQLRSQLKRLESKIDT